MARYAVVVMSEHGEGSPGGQGRMVHALSTVKALQDAGADVSLWFHGIGVTWLAAFDARYDAFTRHYGPLFDEVHGSIGGACDFCTNKRFGVGEVRADFACRRSAARASTTQSLRSRSTAGRCSRSRAFARG